MSVALASAPRAPFRPSGLQKDFFSWVMSGSGSCVLEAVAGSGKSTTIVRSLPYIPATLPVLVLAFNAKIVEEMKAKVAALAQELDFPMRNVRVATFHSLGFGALRKQLGDNIKTDKNKCRDLARQLWNEETCEEYADFCCELVSFAKGEGLGAIRPANRADYLALIDHHDMELPTEDGDVERAVALAHELLLRSNEIAKDKKVVDFDDMLYLPLLWRLRFFPQRWVFVDEAQDTNPVRRAIVRKTLAIGGRCVAVGDRRQAIYGFTGASADALDQIAADFSATRMPLNVSYRCPRVAETLVASHAPEFQAAPDAIKGEVVRGATLDDTLRLVGQPRRLPEGGTAADAVLCRNVAPLVSLAYALIRRKVPCHVAGRDIGAGLQAFVKKMRAKTIDSLLVKMEEHREREVERFLAEKKEGKAEAVHDRVACVMEFIDNLREGQRTIPRLLQEIGDVFQDGQATLALMSIHRSKGLEFETVAVLRPDLSPSPWARQEWQQEQERNLAYVRDTRFMKRIVFMAEDGTEKRQKGGVS